MSFLEILLFVFIGLLGLGITFNSIGYFLPSSFELKTELEVNAFQAEIKSKLFSDDGIRNWLYPSDDNPEILITESFIEVNLKRGKVKFLIMEMNKNSKFSVQSEDKNSANPDSITTLFTIETVTGKNGISIKVTELFNLKKAGIRLLFKLHYKNAAEILHQKRLEKIRQLF